MRTKQDADANRELPGIRITRGDQPHEPSELLSPEAFPDTRPDPVEREVVDGIPAMDTVRTAAPCERGWRRAAPAGRCRRMRPSSSRRCGQRIRAFGNAPSLASGPAPLPGTSCGVGWKRRIYMAAAGGGAAPGGGWASSAQRIAERFLESRSKDAPASGQAFTRPRFGRLRYTGPDAKCGLKNGSDGRLARKSASSRCTSSAGSRRPRLCDSKCVSITSGR